MKAVKLLFVISLMTPTTLCLTQGCHSQTRQAQSVQTLKTVGYAAKAALDGAWSLKKEGKIADAQWQAVASFYDGKFQPAYRAAFDLAKADANAPAPLHVVALLTEFKSIAK